MKVTKFIVENFGPHRSLTIEAENGVIGITGPNGSGKTSLLTALEFAITGEITGNRKDYIRAGSTQGFVEVHFSHRGHVGSIKRWLSASKREMTWDGESIVKAAKVDEMLGNILGANKESFRNASFIRQGDLKSVLDGTDTQRRAVMVRLESLSFVEKRRDELDRYIKAYVERHLDDTIYGRRDQAQEEATKLDQQIDDTHKQMLVMRDYRADLNAVTTHRANLARVDELRSRRELLLSRQANINAANVQAYKEARAETSQLDSKIESLGEQVTRLADTLTTRANMVQTEDRLTKVRADLRSINQNLEGLARTATTDYKLTLSGEMVAQLAEQVTHANVLLQSREALERLVPEAEELQQSISDTNTRLAELRVACADLQRRLALTDHRIASEQASLSAISQSIEGRTATCSGNVATCAICKLDVIPVEMLTQETLDDIRLRTQELQAERDGLQASLLSHSNEQSTLQQTCIKLQGRQGTVERDTNQARASIAAALNVLHDDLDATGLRDLQQKYAACRQLHQVQQQLTHQQQSLNAERFNLEERLNNLRASDRNKKPTEELRAERATIEQERATLTERRRVLRETMQSYQVDYQSYNDMAYEISQIDDELLPLALQRCEHFAPTAGVLDLIAELDTTDYAVIHTVMLERSNALHKLQVTFDVLVKERAARVRALSVLNTRINQQRKHKAVTDRLLALKDLMSSDSVLNTFLMYRFRKLSNAVSNTLNQLGADFVVRPCSDSLSFEFIRSNDPSEQWLSMRRLSGGQKVKLGIAFLIAIQQLVCRDINFLVLDEPSTHLDEASVDALGSLLEDMSKRMQGGDGQFWVVDHHTNLIDSLSQNYRLTNK